MRRVGSTSSQDGRLARDEPLSSARSSMLSMNAMNGGKSQSAAVELEDEEADVVCCLALHSRPCADAQRAKWSRGLRWVMRISLLRSTMPP